MMNELVPMSSADLDESDVQAVASVVRSGRLALGPNILEFERRVAEFSGVKHAVAVNSGTSALHLMSRAIRLGPGDEVLVPSFTFVASANAFMFDGAKPVFVDIDPDTFNLDPSDIEHRITPNTKAIMVVDVFGHPAEWDEINRIASAHGLKALDDSCEAIGAEYKGTRLGSFGDAAAFAFYPNKQMTTGEGGMLVTNDDEIAAVARSLRNQGRSAMGAWLEHEEMGYNYRMDEMSAALGASQIKRLDAFLDRRDHVAQMYTERLSQYDWVRCPVIRPWVRMSWFNYVVLLTEKLDRDMVMGYLSRHGIPTRNYFAPVHLQEYMKKRFDYRGGELPVTEAISRRTVALPFHNNMTSEQVDIVVEGLCCAAESLRVS